MKLHNIIFCNTTGRFSAPAPEAQPSKDREVGFWIPDSTLRGGFTLIEILVIVALFAFLMSIGALMGFDSITRSTVHNERDLVVLMLTGARTRALANINENAQGVRITASEIILFEGDAFDDFPNTHRSTARNSAITATLTPNVDIVFDQLSAAVANDINIELEDTSGKTADIDINGQGRIEW